MKRWLRRIWCWCWHRKHWEYRIKGPFVLLNVSDCLKCGEEWRI